MSLSVLTILSKKLEKQKIFMKCFLAILNSMVLLLSDLKKKTRKIWESNTHRIHLQYLRFFPKYKFSLIIVHLRQSSMINSKLCTKSEIRIIYCKTASLQCLDGNTVRYAGSVCLYDKHLLFTYWDCALERNLKYSY